MALVKCPSCGADIPSEAAACPKCGHPMKATPAGGINPKDPVHMVGIAIVIIIVLAIIVYFVATLASR